MSTFEANPHLRYGCAYIRLFAGQWHIEGSLDTPGDTYGLVIAYINAVALALEASNASLLRETYPPFPDFSYMLVLTHRARALVLIIGRSPFHTTREAIFRDLSQAPFPTSVESLVSEPEQERGWRNCLAIVFPADIMFRPIEQRTALIEAEAHTLAERLLIMHQEPEPQQPTLRPHSLASLIADEELRRRCGDLLGAENDFDRVIAQACLILEDRVRRAIGADGSLYGRDLMGRAFNTTNGLLLLSDRDGEQQGILSIYQGLMAFFRNNISHSIVTTYTQHDAFCAVMWVDLLLQLVATASERARATTVTSDSSE